jgi:hypothetical protein
VPGRDDAGGGSGTAAQGFGRSRSGDVVDAKRAEEREAEVREAEAMQNALEAALHDDVTKSAKRDREALLGASTCALLCERIRDSKDRVVAHRWRDGPVWLPARPAQTSVAWLALQDRHPACLRRYGVVDLAR